jgi:hypothetical protein
MKFEKIVEFLNELEDKCGSDLVYSISLMEGNVYFTCASHKSEGRAFESNDKITGKIEESDFKKNVSEIVNEAKRIIEENIISREEYEDKLSKTINSLNNEEIVKNAIKRTSDSK